jgi:hypothetical protein
MEHAYSKIKFKKYIYTYIHIHTFIHTHTYTHIHTHIYIHIHTYTIHTYIYIHIIHTYIKKAPGLDDITGVIYQRMFHMFPRIITTI